MSKTAGYLWVAIAAAAMLAGGLAFFYLDHSAKDRTQQYLELAETYTIAFSDRAALYLSRGRPEDLNLLASTASTLLFGKVILYVQVVSNAQTVVDARSSAGEALDLPMLSAPVSAQRELHTLQGGALYVDVIKDLFPLHTQEGRPLEGYVRIGTSLSQLQADLWLERLIVAAIALAVWGVLVLCAWLSTRWLFPFKAVSRRADSTSVASPVPPPAGSAPRRLEPVLDIPGPWRKIGELAIDDARKSVELRGQPVELSPKEFDLLKLLCQEPGRVYSNEEILKGIWAEQSFASAQDVKQYIYFLRRKLEPDPKRPRTILTVRGFGYKVEPHPDGSSALPQD